MPHFKDQNGGLFWLDVQDVEAWKREGWQEVTDEEAASIRGAVLDAMPIDRRAQIVARLAQIDAESIRAMRAVARGKAEQKDRDKLEVLEVEAGALRSELAELSKGGKS